MQIISMALRRQSDSKSCWYAHVFLCCTFHSNTSKNIAQKMVIAESLTVSLQRTQSNGFRCCCRVPFFWALPPFRFQSEFHYEPVCIGIFSIISTFFHTESLECENDQSEANANVFNDSTRCAQFLLFDVVSCPFFMHRNKSSTFIRAEQTKPESIHCPASPSYFIFRYTLVILQSSIHLIVTDGSYLIETTCYFVDENLSFRSELGQESHCALMLEHVCSHGMYANRKTNIFTFAIFQEEIHSSRRLYGQRMHFQWNAMRKSHAMRMLQKHLK